ncbi:lytic transglycosylase domain-containing protein [Streptomyces sp. NPDC003487]
MDSDSVRVPPLRLGDYDPADYAGEVVRSAEEVGVSPRLVMGVLHNEAYKPHHPLLERLWQWWKPEASSGVANMHRAAFEQVRRTHGLSGRWQDRRDDPAFAIHAAALHLKDLDGRLPERHVRRYTRDELLALGYDAGERTMRAFARGVPPEQAICRVPRPWVSWATSSSSQPPSSKARARRRCGAVLPESETSQIRAEDRESAGA